MKKKLILSYIISFTYIFAFSQNANVSYEVRVSSIFSSDGSSISGSSCWETSNEEYTANVRIDGPTVGTNFCLQDGGAGSSSTYGGGTVLRNSTDVATTLFTVVYDIFEDDTSPRCTFNSGDDCRAVGNYNIAFVNSYSPTAANTYTNFTDNQVYNAGSSQHRIRLDNSWRYSGTANAISPTCQQQSVGYSSGGIRSWSVFLTAGRTYRFGTCGAGIDTYIRIYSSNGYTNVANFDDNGPLCSGTAASGDYTPPSSGWYYIEVAQFSRNALSASGTLTYEDITPAPGNPAVFGNGTWNVYGYNGGNINLTGEYAGFYTESNLSYNSTNRWGTNGSPSDASGWQGCYVPIDNHVVVSKRTNFTCGIYQLDIPLHDDDIRVYVNGTLVFSHEPGCCDVHTNIWTGYLTASSTIEVRHLEGGGGSNQGLTLTTVTPGLTGGSVNSGGATSVSICAGTDLAAFTNVTSPGGGTIGVTNGSPAAPVYQWEQSPNGSTGWVNVTGGSGANTVAYDPPAISTLTYYRRKVTDACGTVAYSNSIQVSITPPQSNDNCASAVALCRGYNSVSFNNICATGSGTGPGGTPYSADVWYSYNPPVTGSYTIATCGTAFDTYLEVLDGCAGTVLAYNDDNCGLQSSLTVTLNAGTTYFIRVAGYNSSFSNTGTGTLTVSPPTTGLSYGSNTWNIHTFNGYNLTTYAGIATNTTTSEFNLGAFGMGVTANPSVLAGYIGCNPGNDNWSISARRQGFPCATYNVNLIGHDDEYILNIDNNGDGTVDFSSTAGCCNIGLGTKWTGILNASSRVEIILKEGGGDAYIDIDFVVISSALSSGGTIGGAAVLTQCDGGNPALFTVSGITGGVGTLTYQWEEQVNCTGAWNPISGQTTLSYDPPVLNLPLTSMCYRLRTTDQCGTIVYSSTKTINIVPDPVSQTINANPVSGTSICVGSGVSATFSGGSGGTGTVADVYEFSTNGGTSWATYTPGTTITATAGMVGTNMIQIRTQRTATGTGCNNGAVNTAIWTVVPSLVLTPGGTNTSCNGGNNGTASVSASGGTGTYTYSWYSGGSGSSISSLVAGTYTVLVTSGPCSATTSYTVTQPIAISGSASAGTILCNGGTTTLTVTASGGTGALQYSLNGGAYQSGNTFTVNAAGSPYTVTVRDANNCTATLTAVTVTQPTAISGSASAGTILCNGGTTTLTVTASGGTGALQYSLNGGAYQSGNTFTVNAAGSPYTVTVRDANNCTATLTAVTVTQPTAISGSASAGTILCNGGTTTLTVTASGGTGALQYSLNGGAYQSGNTFTVNAAGSPYTVTVRDANNCTATLSAVTVTQPTAISGSASAGTILCNGGTTTLTVTASGGTGALQYSLNGGAYQSGNTFTVNAAGSPYTVTVRDANNCTATLTAVTVTQPTAISGSASAGTILCNGGTTTLTVTASGGTGALQYSLNGGAYQSGNTFTVNAAGSPYTVTVRDANNCTATLSAVTVTQPTAISGSASAGTILCNGGTTTLTVTASGGTGALQYSLNGGAYQSGNTFTVNAAGSPYTVTVRDANNCTATLTAVTVTQPTAISGSASAGTILCNGGTTTLTVTASGGTGALQYSLNGGAYQSGNTFTVNAAGSPYTVTVRDANNCTATLTAVTVTQPTAISGSASAGTILCNGGTTTLTVTASGGTGALQYSLNGGAYQSGNTFTVNAAGSPYTVTVRDANNCTATLTAVTVTQPTAISGSASAGTILCNGGTTTLTVTASGGTGTLQYSLNGGAYQSGNTFTVNAAGSPYTVTVRDANNCTATLSAVTVTQPTAISGSTNAGTILCNGGTTTLTVTASGGTGTLQYSLNGGAYQSGNTFTVNAAGSPYTVTVKDANNCTATLTAVTVTQPPVLLASTCVKHDLCQLNQGEMSVQIDGGTQPYTISWTPAGGTPASPVVTSSPQTIITGLTGGVTYTITVTDANGCNP